MTTDASQLASHWKPPRLICRFCGGRWAAHPRLPDGQLPACPTCGAVDAHGREPLNSGWWAYASGQTEEAVEAALDAERAGCHQLPPSEVRHD